MTQSRRTISSSRVSASEHAAPSPPAATLTWVRFLLVLILCLASSSPHARDLSQERFEVRLGNDSISVFTYRPLHCASPGLLLVFHGKGRKASKMRSRARPLADRTCLAVIAPLFDEETFPNWRYHRAGVVRKGRLQPREQWTGYKVDALVAWARRWLGNDQAPYFLFGHSAGGQFLSRVSAYTPPADPERILIANPSVHVLPSLTESVPYGFGYITDTLAGEGNVRDYLNLPITIYIGSDDTGRKNLVTNEAAMRQGINRFERANFVYEMARDLADSRDWSFSWRLVIAGGVGHSSKGMLQASEIDEALGLDLMVED